MASSDAAAHSQGALLRLLKQADGNILRFAKMISVTSNLDTVYLTISYTLHLLHATLANINAARLASAASALADSISSKAAGAVLPGEVLLAAVAAAPNSRAIRLQSSTAAFLKVIDDFRAFMRLKTLVGMYVWGSTAYKSPNPDPVLRVVTVGQILGCSGFALLENTAYLASKGVIDVGGDATRIPKMFLWSARAWTAHIMLEFVRLWRTAQLKETRSQATGGAGEKMSKSEDALWWQQFYSNSAWAPLAVSWSLGPNGFASEAMVATLGGFTGWTALIRAFKATA